MAGETGAAPRDVAVIDIGSNSVRLVQFRVEGRALWPVFNEKTMAGLGRGARESGRLNPEGVETALRVLKRFSVLLDAKGVTERRAVATAAVRDSEDGDAFIARAEKATGITIETLTGVEEGRRSALGVLNGVGDAHGLTGDLGGSSLELTKLKRRKVGATLSLPLGPLAVGTGDLKTAKAVIDAELGAASKLLKKTGPTFYAVGGAWRAFAHLALAVDEDYPLRLLHQFTLTARQVERIADFAMSQSEASLASVPEISSRRAAGLPYAALLLSRLVKKGRFETVMISANGLREGVVCAADPSLVSAGDPLISGAEALARSVAPEPDFGRALEAWIEPAFADEPAVFGQARDYILRAAAARLADLGARMHPDHRAELTATQILYAPIGGMTHAERAFLALTLHHRYAGKRLREDSCASRRLLDDDGEAAALKLGLALRLGAALSGRSASVLGAFSLKRTKSELALSVEPGAQALVVERALQRFEQLASLFGLDPRVV